MMNPFGTPITNETLGKMSKYKGRAITQEDRAREAINSMHDGDKNVRALQHVLSLKADYGNGVTTLCLVYNATGGPVELVHHIDWLGSLYYKEEEPPPRSFHNGQWLAFLHAHPTSQAYGCEAARVYRAHNVVGQVRDFLIAWCVPWGRILNSAYTEVGERDYFANRWDYVKSRLENAKKISKDEEDRYCASIVSLGGLTSPEFIAVLKHKFGPYLP